MKRPGLLLLLLSLALAGAAPIASAKPTVVIDPGHGGIDRGGMPGQKVPEKGYALDVAQRLSGALRARGFRTVMTRNSDVFIGLRERCAISNRNKGGIFVSVHFNGAPRTGADGVETYYYGNSAGARLAASVHREMVRCAGTTDRGVRSRRLFVLRNNRLPAILVEPGFLTNPQESARVATTSYRQRLAEAIARGIDSRY